MNNNVAATAATPAAATTTVSTHNSTVPTTIGALLTEEYTLDPLSHQPSFLELIYVDVARNSGRVALSAMWEVGVAWLDGVLGRLRLMERLLVEKLLAHSTTTAAFSSPSPYYNHIVALSKTIKSLIHRIRLWYYSHLRRICHVLHGTIKTFGPELQILILFAIDYNCIHYLSGSTACEMVYGLKRSKLVKNSGGDDANNYKVVELTKWDKTMSALLAALFPYCKQRCDKLFRELEEEQHHSPTTSSTDILERRMQISHHHGYRYPPNHQLLQRNTNTTNQIDNFKQKFVNFYPYLHMTHELSIFVYQFAYLLGYTPYWSFSMHTLRVMLRRITVADVQEQQQQQQQQQQSHKQLLQKQNRESFPSDNVIITTKNVAAPMKPSSIIKSALVFSVSYALLSGWVSHFQRELRLRRRRWIAGEESSMTNDDNNVGASRKKTQLPIPPPPMKPRVLLDNGNGRCIEKWSCPICNEPRINPTASTSGYVFCFRCLIMHLRQKGEYCPVTGMLCKESMVIRLYEPTATSSSANRRKKSETEVLNQKILLASDT
jgi:peroxin-12